MKLNLLLFIFLLSVITSCKSEAGKSDSPVKDSVGGHHAIINGDTLEVFNPAADYGDMELFTNIEQVEYCIPVPLKEYSEDFKQNDVRAKHVFVHQSKKGNQLVLQGMFRENPDVSIDDYFNNTFSEEETELKGKIIINKGVNKDNSFFYATGYWNNFIDKSRFLDMYWLRKDDVVHLYADFDIADTSLWKNRLEIFKHASGICQ